MAILLKTEIIIYYNNTCDTAELIIENHTQTVPGFLFNKGRGRTEFRRGLLKVNDSIYIVGGDTLRMNPWLQGGNRFGTTGSFGTMDNNPIDFYSNSLKRARLTNNGSLQIGNVLTDNGEKLQVTGTNGAVTILANLSRSTDRIQIGNNINSGDGQNILIRTSNDNGNTYNNVLVERDGYIGLGTTDNPRGGWFVGMPALRLFNNGPVMVSTSSFFLGQPWGNYNSSCLKTYVSNLNEWEAGIGNYPNRQYYYSFGTYLGGQEGGNVRADLRLGGRNLRFFTGGFNEGVEAGSFSENTENHFDDWKGTGKYAKLAYFGDNGLVAAREWLDLSSHEEGQVKQWKVLFKSKAAYLTTITVAYLLGGFLHDFRSLLKKVFGKGEAKVQKSLKI